MKKATYRECQKGKETGSHSMAEGRMSGNRRNSKASTSLGRQKKGTSVWNARQSSNERAVRTAQPNAYQP